MERTLIRLWESFMETEILKDLQTEKAHLNTDPYIRIRIYLRIRIYIYIRTSARSMSVPKGSSISTRTTPIEKTSAEAP